MSSNNEEELDVYNRLKAGIFREKVLEIYAKNPFKGTATAKFQRGLNDGSYKLNSDDFEQLLRYWGTSIIDKETSNNGMGLLELVSRYGSVEDLHTLSGFCDWRKTDIENILKWSEESENENIIKALEQTKMG